MMACHGNSPSTRAHYQLMVICTQDEVSFCTPLVALRIRTQREQERFTSAKKLIIMPFREFTGNKCSKNLYECQLNFGEAYRDDSPFH